MSNPNMYRSCFGNYLKAKIDALPERKSSEQLAILIKERSSRRGTSVLSVTSSLIRHWLNGTRVPAIGHAAIPFLAEILNVDIQELEQEQLKALRQQSTRKDEERRAKQQEQDRRGTLESFARTPIDQSRRGSVRKKPAIKGTQNLMEQAVSILNNLPDLSTLSKEEMPKDEDRTIIMTSQGHTSALQAPGVSADLESVWYGAIKNVLEKGWHVYHLIRVDEIEGSSQRLIKVITDLLTFVGQNGDYHPFAFTQTFPVAYSPMIVPSWDGALHKPEAMLSFAGENIDYIDSAIWTNHPDQVRILSSHAKQLKSIAKRIFSDVFKLPKQTDMLKALQGNCEESSDQIVILKRLNDVVIPSSWFTPTSRWAKYMKKNWKLSSTELSELIAAKKTRVESLRKSLKDGAYACKYIYLEGCVQTFSREPEKIINFASANFQPNWQERLEQLEIMLELLDLPNYEVAFLEEEMFLPNEEFDPPGFHDLTKLDIQPYLCSAINKHLVLMEVISPPNVESGENCWIFIDNRVIIDAFHENLSKFWDAIPAQRKDKAYIRRWLKQEIGH
jgi:hypothetical protein